MAGGPLPDAEDPELVCARHLYTRERREAVLHLFRVAASLDSLVVGEPQILGQIKEAYELALRAGAAGPLLGGVFSQAFRVARKVRRDTGIAAAKVSVSSVAVDLARQVWGGFKGRRVLMVGAGKMADLACRVLVREGATLAIVNRTHGKAEELADAPGRGGAALGQAARGAGARGHRVRVHRGPGVRADARLVEHARKARHGAPLLLMDIAVPRNIDPAVGNLDGVYLYDIDDLNKIVGDNQQDRRQEADRAEAMIEQEITQFLARLRSRSAGPTIAALRAKASGVARSEAEKALAALPDGRRAHAAGDSCDGGRHRQQVRARPVDGAEEALGRGRRWGRSDRGRAQDARPAAGAAGARSSRERRAGPRGGRQQEGHTHVSDTPGKLVIGTRGSALARWQSEHIAAALRAAHPGLEVTLSIIVTEGDRFQTGPVIEVGGKGSG